MKKVRISFGVVILMIGCLFGFKKYQFNQFVEKNMLDYVSTNIVDKNSIDTSSLSYNWMDNTYKYKVSFSKSTDSYISLEYNVPQPIITVVLNDTLNDFQPAVYTHFNGKTIDFDNKLTETIFEDVPFNYTFSTK